MRISKNSSTVNSQYWKVKYEMPWSCYTSSLRRLLTEDTIVILSLAVDAISIGEWKELYGTLNSVEYDRVQSFHFDLDRRAYTAAHALLRHSLSAVIQADPADWRFATGAFGKPHLADPPPGCDLRFNLSHSRSRVAVALALGAEVGVDVEALDRATPLDPGIADACFAPDEAVALRAIETETLRRERFLRLWTLKEACIKATGHGLSQPLNAFSIDPDRLWISSPSLQIDRWRLAQWRIGAHQLAVAVVWPHLTPPRFIHQILVK